MHIRSFHRVVARSMQASKFMTTTQPESERHPEVRRAYDQLIALRDDVKVRLHLAAMDIRDEWNRLEPRIADAERDVERLAKQAGTVSTGAVAGALNDLALELHRLAKKIGTNKDP